MNCPRCAGRNLSPEVQAGVEVDRCPGCEGVWLDQGEGEMLTRPGELPDAVVAEVAALARSTAVSPDASAPLVCPRCEATMQRELYAESKVEIDRCGCGVWLDRGEMEKIAAYRTEAMERLQRQKDAAPTGPGGVDLSFSPATLERAFARIYFDVGKKRPGT